MVSREGTSVGRPGRFFSFISRGGGAFSGFPGGRKRGICARMSFLLFTIMIDDEDACVLVFSGFVFSLLYFRSLRGEEDVAAAGFSESGTRSTLLLDTVRTSE